MKIDKPLTGGQENIDIGGTTTEERGLAFFTAIAEAVGTGAKIGIHFGNGFAMDTNDRSKVAKVAMIAITINDLDLHVFMPFEVESLIDAFEKGNLDAPLTAVQDDDIGRLVASLRWAVDQTKDDVETTYTVQ